MESVIERVALVNYVIVKANLLWSQTCLTSSHPHCLYIWSMKNWRAGRRRSLWRLVCQQTEGTACLSCRFLWTRSDLNSLCHWRVKKQPSMVQCLYNCCLHDANHPCAHVCGRDQRERPHVTICLCSCVERVGIVNQQMISCTSYICESGRMIYMS